ncbi:MAG: DMT family transporter [Alphaproteobacteria bacterium]|nr:DMT family transporter [Alphaproteobacteria bacterium]
MLSAPPDWLWIACTIGAALSQSIRTALQKHLKGRLSTNGASFTRFIYALPFAALYILVLHNLFGLPLPALNWRFMGWVLMGGVAQIMATSFLLHVFAYRNFAVGVAYSKTEPIQTVPLGLLFLGERVPGGALFGIIVSTVAVMVMSWDPKQGGLRQLLTGWITRPALIGIASGGLFGVAAIGFRGAALTLTSVPFVMAAGFTLFWATLLQTVLMSGWLLAREPGQIARVGGAWRIAIWVGVTGAIASGLWFTAFTLQTVAYVRTLALVELIFTTAYSGVLFKEVPRRVEVAGIALLMVGLGALLNFR